MKKELAIGEIAEISGVKIKCVESNNGDSTDCLSCVKSPICLDMPCHVHERTDGKNVYYEKIETVKRLCDNCNFLVRYIKGYQSDNPFLKNANWRCIRYKCCLWSDRPAQGQICNRHKFKAEVEAERLARKASQKE
jgi:hypothetical protein